MSYSNFAKIMVLLFFMATVTGASTADVINPGEKNIPYNYKISNIQDFPDYVFILHGIPNPSIEILNSSEFSFYKLSTCSIYAVPRTVFNSLKLDDMDDTQIEDFLNNDSRVARSNLTLEGTYGTVNVANSLENALIVLKIHSINGNSLDIQKDKIIYSYNNGQTVEKTFQDQNKTPEPTPPGPSWDFYVYFIVLPILALAAIIFILIRRRSS